MFFRTSSDSSASNDPHEVRHALVRAGTVLIVLVSLAFALRFYSDAHVAKNEAKRAYGPSWYMWGVEFQHLAQYASVYGCADRRPANGDQVQTLCPDYIARVEFGGWEASPKLTPARTSAGKIAIDLTSRWVALSCDDSSLPCAGHWVVDVTVAPTVQLYAYNSYRKTADAWVGPYIFDPTLPATVQLTDAGTSVIEIYAGDRDTTMIGQPLEKNRLGQ